MAGEKQYGGNYAGERESRGISKAYKQLTNNAKTETDK
jgi:hypothetical protein